MRPSCHVILFLVFWIPAAQARSSIVPVNERCVDSIVTAYTYITFAGSTSRKFLDQRCQNPLAVTSIYASSDVYCRPEEREAGIARLDGICSDAGLELLSRDSVRENLTEDAIRGMRRVDYGELDMSEGIKYPVLLSAEYFRRVFLTMDTWAFESWTHYAYGYLGYLYWALVLSLGMLNRIVQYFFVSRSDITPSALVLFQYTPLRRIHHFLYTHLLVPTALPSNGRRLLCWTFSNRAEALVTLGFWILSIALCSVSYRLSTDNIYWPSTSTQLIRYMADRTGIISFANLPLLWLFAGRNNICAWATGWNFATFNVFHRHVAWIATIQAVVHTVLYLVLFFENSNPWRKLSKPYLLWGTLAMAVMILILPAAVTWFRHRAYETFLFIHIVFSIVLLVGCFYHTIIFETHEYWFYLWLSVGTWVFDRGLRIIRVIYGNVHVRFHQGSGTRVQVTTSTATYDKAADLITLTVVPGSAANVRPCPGRYYFLYQPFRLSGWENHPFTLGRWEYQVKVGRSLSGSGRSTPRVVKGDETVDISQIPLLSDSSSSDGAARGSLSANEPSQLEMNLKLTFWIRPYDGWTRQLRDRCLRSPDFSTRSTILLEGPYGHEFPLWRYDSVLLLAGGTGIASAVPYIRDHIARSEPLRANKLGSGAYSDLYDEDLDGNGEKSRTRIKDMHLVWVTRQEAFIHRLLSTDLRTALGREDFRASFYATCSSRSISPLRQPQHRQLISHSQSSNIPTLPPPELDNDAEVDTDIRPGRPNLKKTITAFAEEAHISDCSAAVLVSGPQKMADEARGAVAEALKRGYQLAYAEESFSW
ncbi:ferric reductase like transmembrane component-domain-containing protein [Aspergillus nidulans var. acristatus]